MTHDQKTAWKLWVRATLVRVIRVSAAAAVGTIGAQTVLTEIKWEVVAAAAALAGIIEALVCLASLPEAPSPVDMWGTNEKGPDP